MPVVEPVPACDDDREADEVSVAVPVPDAEPGWLGERDGDRELLGVRIPEPLEDCVAVWVPDCVAVGACVIVSVIVGEAVIVRLAVPV